jgi:hypothetical protein
MVVSRNPAKTPPSIPSGHQSYRIAQAFYFVLNGSADKQKHCNLCLSLFLCNLLLKKFVLQLICQSFRVLAALWSGEMCVALTSSTGVEVLAIRAGSQSYLWDCDLVFPCGCPDFGRTNVCCSSTAGAEGTVAVVTNNSLANDLPITVTMSS